MGFKTPTFEYVNGYKIVEVDGPAFKVYDGDRHLAEPFPYSGEAAAYANSLPKRDQQPKRQEAWEHHRRTPSTNVKQI